MRLLVLILLLYPVASTYAQFQGMAVYDAIINRSQDGTPREEMYKEDLYAKAFLYFSEKTSTYRQLLPDSSVYIRSGGGQARVSMKMSIEVKDTLGMIYSTNFEDSSIKARMTFFDLNNFHVVDDKVQPIQWTITGETKTIGKWKATKATTQYLGRKWTAWFSADIPVSAGPWKLYGLPGLILEAEDANRKFLFHLKQVTVPYKENTQSTLSLLLNDKKSITKKDFVTLENKRKDDQYRFTKARMEAAGGESASNSTISIKFPETVEVYE